MKLKSHALKALLALTLVPASGGLLGGMQVTKADAVSAHATASTVSSLSSTTAPEILPLGIPNGKKVLFDSTHGQTSGAADWVIDGGFSDFANALAAKGYDVQELAKHTPITYDDLKNYDVFIIGEANIPYKQSEQDAMLKYVQNGGSIFFIADHYNSDRNQNRWDAGEVMNGYRRGAWTDPAKGMRDEERNSPAMQGVTSSDWLGQNFGVRFRYNAVGDMVANNIVSPDQSFGITNGVHGVAVHSGSTLAILDPHKAKGIAYLPESYSGHAVPRWSLGVDQGVYNGGGVAEGPFVAISKVLGGKAAFIGDSSAVEDASPKYVREDNATTKGTYDGFKENDDATLLTNTVDWLATKENYQTLDQAPGHIKLDPVTQLLPSEDPAASTEPQPEPWGTVYAGYKWYDNSTWKPGSYGAMINWVTDQDTAVTGVWNPGASVTVANGSTVLAQGTVGADGTYSVALQSAQAAGTTLTLTLTDATTGVTKTGTVKVTPATPTINTVTDKDVTITGTSEPGDTVYLTTGVNVNVTPVSTATVQADGTFTMTLKKPMYSGQFLTFTTRDAAGNIGFPVIVTTQDTIAPNAPNAKAVADTDTTVSGTAEKNATVLVKAGDQLLGEAYVYSDGTYVVPIAKQPGGTVLSVIAEDQAHNDSPVVNVTVNDTTAPTTTATLSGQANDKGYYNQDVTVTLNGTDAGVGVATTEYQLNGGDWTPYTAPFTISSEGTTTVQFRSTDKAGNVETAQSLTINLDKTAPTATLTQSGAAVHNVTSDGTLSFDLSASDALSGVASQQLLLDGKAYVANTEITALSLGVGTHTVEAIVTDNAGNVTDLKQTFLVDTSFATIQNLINQFGQAGDYKNEGVQKALTAQLAIAQAQFAKGHQEQAVDALQALQATIHVFVANGNITASAGDALNQNIAYLLANGLK